VRGWAVRLGGTLINRRSTREIGLMRKAGQLVWLAHHRAAKLIRPGVTTGELDAAVQDVFDQNNAIGLFKGYPHSEPGGVPFPAVTCVSVNEEVVHGIPGDRVLCEGDIVSLDTGSQIHGWCGDAAVTHPVGEIAPKLQKLLDVTQGVLNLAIEQLAVKDLWSDVAREMAAYVKGAGFSVVTQFVGHGIGREMHEYPQVPNYDSEEFRSEGDFHLRPGLVIAIEPMVNMGVADCETLKDGWTVVTQDRLPSAHFEHTIALTESGPRILTGPPEPGEEEWFV